MQWAALRGDLMETGDATRSQDYSECEVHWPLLRGAYKEGRTYTGGFDMCGG